MVASAARLKSPDAYSGFLFVIERFVNTAPQSGVMADITRSGNCLN